MNMTDQGRAFALYMAGQNDDRLFERAGFEVTPNKTLQFRAMATTSSTNGAKARPADFVDAINVARDLTAPVRRLATVVETTNGQRLPWPTVDDTDNSGAMLAENTADSATDVEVGEVVFGAFKYTSGQLKMSMEFANDTSPTIQAYLGTILGQRVARKLNADLTVGAGTTEPTGVVTASTEGKVAASASVVTLNELIDLMDSLDDAYEADAKWMMAPATLTQIKKMLDGADHPYWHPIIGGDGVIVTTLLGKEVVVNPAMPAIAADAKTILFGDFSHYVVRETPVELKVARERFAELGQIAFTAWTRADGNLLQADSIKYLVMGS